MNPHDITYNLDITHRELAAIEAWHKQFIANLREYTDKYDNYNIKSRIGREILQRQERCIQLSTALPATQQPTKVTQAIKCVMDYIVSSEMEGRVDPEDSWYSTHQLLHELHEKVEDEESLQS